VKKQAKDKNTRRPRIEQKQSTFP